MRLESKIRMHCNDLFRSRLIPMMLDVGVMQKKTTVVKFVEKYIKQTELSFREGQLIAFFINFVIRIKIFDLQNFKRNGMKIKLFS